MPAAMASGRPNRLVPARKQLLILDRPQPFIVDHMLYLLPIVAASSIVILIATYLVPLAYRSCRKLFSRRADYQPILVDEDDVEEPSPPSLGVLPSRGLISDFRKHVRSLQEYGSILFAMEVVRALCLCTLLGLSIYAAIKAEAPGVVSATESGWDLKITKHSAKKHKGKNHKGHKGHHDKSTLDEYSSLEWGEFGVCAFYVGHPTIAAVR